MWILVTQSREWVFQEMETAMCLSTYRKKLVERLNLQKKNRGNETLEGEKEVRWRHGQQGQVHQGEACTSLGRAEG